MSLLFDAVAALLLVAAAVGVATAVAPRPAVIAFIGFGLLLGLAWVRLDAPDVALTEIAIGSGISGLVLLRVVRVEAASWRPGVNLPAAALAVGVAGALAMVVLALPDPAPTLAPEVAAALPATGLGNPVTGVLIVFRVLDTLLEKFVLLLALVGVWALSRDPDWRGRPAPLAAQPAPAPSAFLARMLAPIGVVVGVYLLWAGADAPGGAFQSGAVLAAMALLLLMTAQVRLPSTGSRVVRALLLAGPFGLLFVGYAGWAAAGSFLAYPPGFEKVVIKAVEMVITASIAVTLALIVLGPPEGERQP